MPSPFAGPVPASADLRGANPLERAYAAQVAAVTVCCTDAKARQNGLLTLLALALGSFSIGTSEFASMGIIQLFSTELGLSLPDATHAITAYAFGVIIGAPLVTLAAARLNRRIVLLCLMALFVLGNLLSAAAGGLGHLAAARFVSGLPQGAYFGAGAVVAAYIVGPNQAGKAFAVVMTGLTVATIVGSPLATFLGQALGWRNTYLVVSGVGLLSLVAILRWVPRTSELAGSPVRQELSALRKPQVWGVLLVAAIGVGSIFAVYTFIAPIVTDVARLGPGLIPVALAVFGCGMTAGNILGGRMADAHPILGIVLGFGGALVVLAALATGGQDGPVMFASMFGVGALMMTAIPTLQVRLTRFAPEAPSLMGAMNLASLNLANAIGAWTGGVVISAGHRVLSTAWAGFALTLAGLVIFGLTLSRPPRGSVAQGPHVAS